MWLLLFVVWDWWFCWLFVVVVLLLLLLLFRVSPSQAARLDPEGRGAARRAGRDIPPQDHPKHDLTGFRVFYPPTPLARGVDTTTPPSRFILNRARLLFFAGDVTVGTCQTKDIASPKYCEN